MSAPQQWMFNVTLVLFMLIVVPIAIVLATLFTGKEFAAQIIAGVLDGTRTDAASLAEGEPARPHRQHRSR